MGVDLDLTHRINIMYTVTVSEFERSFVVYVLPLLGLLIRIKIHTYIIIRLYLVTCVDTELLIAHPAQLCFFLV